jgi:tetratricopeptide (TPR) repeat protein
VQKSWRCRENDSCLVVKGHWLGLSTDIRQDTVASFAAPPEIAESNLAARKPIMLAGGALSILLATLFAQPAAPNGLGEIHFDVSCPEAAQAPFDRAVALLHHMTYPRARAEFTAIAAAHPTCAMAHWGIAMTLFQPLWPTRPTDEDLRQGWQAVSRAREIAAVTPREKMFIASAAAFFDPSHKDYWERIAHWAQATRALYEAYPEDLEVKAFFALSHLATAPASGDMSHHATAAAVLEEVLREQPAHPGAVHYTIHANDAVGRERVSLNVVRGYDQIAPRNPHALHMPTHIFVLLGEWDAVITGNRRAADAALENRAGDRQQWVWDEFPHALEYLVYAQLQVGNDAAALQAMTELQQTADLQPSFKTAFHLSSIPARYELERRDWKGAAALEPRPQPTLPWDRFPWPEAVTWFARGMGAARSEKIAAAQEAEARLGRLRDASKNAGEDLFTRQTEILRLGVAAWIAHASDDDENALRLMREAVSLEANTPKHAVTPAPTLPASELLGDLLLEMNRGDAALQAYRASLQTAPRRFNSLVGAARSARQMGDTAQALAFYRELRALAAAGSRRPEVEEAAAFLSGVR